MGCDHNSSRLRRLSLAAAKPSCDSADDRAQAVLERTQRCAGQALIAVVLLLLLLLLLLLHGDSVRIDWSRPTGAWAVAGRAALGGARMFSNTGLRSHEPAGAEAAMGGRMQIAT